MLMEAYTYIYISICACAELEVWRCINGRICISICADTYACTSIYKIYSNEDIIHNNTSYMKYNRMQWCITYNVMILYIFKYIYIYM